jgi:soluble lytic murein transglycosylase-like protein
MVQEFKERTVQQSGQVPGYQNVSYSPDAFGAASARALQGLGGSISDVGQIIARVDEEKKTNDVIDTVNKARDELRPVLYDPSKGIFAKQGQNAMNASADYETAAQPIYKKYIESETDPRKRRMLEKMWSQESDQNKDKVAIHELKELGNYKTEVSKATMYGAMEDAYNGYNDNKVVDAAIARSITAIEVNAEGLPPEALDLMKKEATSNIRLAAISRWAAEDPSKALTYYEQHKEDLSGKDHVAATQFVKAARKAQDVAHATAQILGTNRDGGFFRSRIVPAESSNNPNAVSRKNAIGLSQLTIPTARDMAKLTGHTELNGLTDAQLTEKLKADPDLNLELGEARWTQQLTRLNNDVEAALVAYNAGPDAADAFLAHNAGKAPGERDYDVPGWKGIKNESEAYVQKILGGVRTPATPLGQRMTAENWTLKHFRPEDIVAPTEGGAWVDARAAQSLDQLAENFQKKYPGLKVKINEEPSASGVTAGRRRGTSDPKDNPHVRKSQHIRGKAFDVQVQGWTDEQKAAFLADARSLGFTGIGFYGPGGHLHIDMGPARTWGRMPAWARDIMKQPAATVPGGNTDDVATRTGVLGANDKQGYFIDTKKTALGEWMAKADTIEDPEIRAGVMAQVKVQAAIIDNQRDAETAAAKQAAWDHMVNGGSVKDFRPDELSRMDPSFINVLTEFEAKLKKGDLVSDPKAYAKLQSLTDEELVKTDLMTEYANKLAWPELKAELNRQRETRKALAGEQHDSKLLEGTRTRTQIIGDIALENGWDRDDPKLGQLGRILDQRIEGQARDQGKPLTSTEIQDIADKLLIEDKFRSVTSTTVGQLFSGDFGPQGNAMGATNPDAFVAANEWAEVQPDDQKVLIERFEAIRGEAPDAEEATDLYNRAMRVWLGGKPSGPEEELEQIRTALEPRLGKLSPAELEKAHGRYLLKFLGQ